jgi:hypothetical protein
MSQEGEDKKSIRECCLEDTITGLIKNPPPTWGSVDREEISGGTLSGTISLSASTYPYYLLIPEAPARPPPLLSAPLLPLSPFPLCVLDVFPFPYVLYIRGLYIGAPFPFPLPPSARAPFPLSPSRVQCIPFPLLNSPYACLVSYSLLFPFAILFYCYPFPLSPSMSVIYSPFTCLLFPSLFPFDVILT